MQVENLYIYPIKSSLAYPLAQSLVLNEGLAFDRQFMLTELDGKFITARKDAELYNISAFPMPTGIWIKHKNGQSICVQYQDFEQQQNCEVWGTEFPSFIAKNEINQWFSQIFQRPVQLRWLGEKSQRPLKEINDRQVSFADSSPILLTNQQSLQALQQACPAPIKMLQFRPNIVFSGADPFSEQQWDKVQIGEVQFLHLKPSTRCILTTRDPDTNALNEQAEPFRTLKKINTNEQGKPLFGINLMPLNQGIIRVGDKLEVLSYRS